MEFAKIVDGVVQKFPYTKSDARADYPNVSFPKDWTPSPENLASFDIYPVTRLDDPAFDPATQKLSEGVPVDNGGQWEVQRAVVAKTQEDQDAYAEEQAQEADRSALKGDSQVVALLKARPSQINTYIENNVTNLAEAKAVLKILARAVAVIGYATFR